MTDKKKILDFEIDKLKNDLARLTNECGKTKLLKETLETRLCDLEFVDEPNYLLDPCVTEKRSFDVEIQVKR